MTDIDKQLYDDFGRYVYRNKYDIDGRDANTGYAAEDAFELACLNSELYSDIKPATEEENIELHIDFKTSRLGGIDVKAKKESFNEGKIWIEHTNVAGEKGWLHGGANYIAFDWGDHFRLVKRADLVITVGRLTEKAREVKHKSQALYNWYQRKDRKDWLTQVTTDDIFFITVIAIDKHIIEEE